MKRNGISRHITLLIVVFSTASMAPRPPVLESPEGSACEQSWLPRAAAPDVGGAMVHRMEGLFGLHPGGRNDLPPGFGLFAHQRREISLRSPAGLGTLRRQP